MNLTLFHSSGITLDRRRSRFASLWHEVFSLGCSKPRRVWSPFSTAWIPMGTEVPTPLPCLWGSAHFAFLAPGKFYKNNEFVVKSALPAKAAIAAWGTSLHHKSISVLLKWMNERTKMPMRSSPGLQSHAYSNKRQTSGTKCRRKRSELPREAPV